MATQTRIYTDFCFFADWISTWFCGYISQFHKVPPRASPTWNTEDNENFAKVLWEGCEWYYRACLDVLKRNLCSVHLLLLWPLPTCTAHQDVITDAAYWGSSLLLVSSNDVPLVLLRLPEQYFVAVLATLSGATDHKDATLVRHDRCGNMPKWKRELLWRIIRPFVRGGQKFAHCISVTVALIFFVLTPYEEYSTTRIDGCHMIPWIWHIGVNLLPFGAFLRHIQLPGCAMVKVVLVVARIGNTVYTTCKYQWFLATGVQENHSSSCARWWKVWKLPPLVRFSVVTPDARYGLAWMGIIETAPATKYFIVRSLRHMGYWLWHLSKFYPSAITVQRMGIYCLSNLWKALKASHNGEMPSIAWRTQQGALCFENVKRVLLR